MQLFNPERKIEDKIVSKMTKRIGVLKTLKPRGIQNNYERVLKVVVNEF